MALGDDEFLRSLQEARRQVPGPAGGSEADSGPDTTTLSVEAVDADGDALHYQWRVTAGSIDNRDARQT
ncbi:MAG: hypothetical protein ACREXI_06620, partial [Caldimonas sp.]